MNCRCAGIVLFNPEVKRIKENILAIENQVDIIIIVDNNSNNAQQILKCLNIEEKIVTIKNDENYGIAFALNQICEEAKKMSFDWVMLLDQDSICSPNIINSYEKYINDESIALITPYIIDRNKLTLNEYYKLNLYETSVVNWAITSGSLIKLSIWDAIGGFSNELFIDAVDFDYSIRLRINGYKQMRVNNEYLLQEVGHAEPTWIIRPHKDNSGKWNIKRYYRTNHSVIRQYYITRNHIILARKYRKYESMFKRVAFVIIMSLPKLLVEKNKIKLFKNLIKGFYDGFKFKVDIYKVERGK